MGKVKTSKKQKPFSIDDMKPVKLKSGVKTRIYDPGKELRDPDLTAHALLQCLIENDTETFKEILRAHYEAVNTAKTLKQTGLSERTFYEAISPKGNPRLSTVAKIIASLKAG